MCTHVHACNPMCAYACTTAPHARAHVHAQFSSKKDGIIKVFVRPDNYVEKERTAGLMGRIASAFKGGSASGEHATHAQQPHAHAAQQQQQQHHGSGGDGTVSSAAGTAAKTGAAAAVGGAVASALGSDRDRDRDAQHKAGLEEEHKKQKEKEASASGGTGGFFSHLFGGSAVDPQHQTIKKKDVHK